MKIRKLHIQNYKSLVNLEIIEPNPLTVFAGPNASGKSNIFEAIEFANFIFKVNNHTDAENLFGGHNTFLSFNNAQKVLEFNYEFSSFKSSFQAYYEVNGKSSGDIIKVEGDFIIKNHYNFNNYKFGDGISYKDYFSKKGINYENEIEQFQQNYSRLFIGDKAIQKIRTSADKQLNSDGENLEKVLNRLLRLRNVKEEFLEMLSLLVPGFNKIEIHNDIISGNDTLLFFEEHTHKPFRKGIISNGTFDILCLLTAVLQSDQPQFLCIEEPENGLNPYVIKTLVNFFRKQCMDKGHYIWLNTHSQTLVKNLLPEELILVDKVNGATQIKQFAKDYNLHGLELDEAWLSNALGGGVPW